MLQERRSFRQAGNDCSRQGPANCAARPIRRLGAVEAQNAIRNLDASCVFDLLRFMANVVISMTWTLGKGSLPKA
jgi:hypothetical protein